MSVRISAVVCTYNRADDLVECLKALRDQTIGRDKYEVIVVDNNSSDNTRQVVKDFSKRMSNLRLVKETKQGLAPARNRALNEARSEFVAFTDDDALPASDWLERIADHFERMPNTVVAIGGEVEPIWEADRPTWLTDSLLHPISAGLKWSRKARYLKSSEWLIEVNVAYRRSLLQRFGGFPESLGRVGHNLLSGENAVNYLLSANDYKFFFDPEIVVQHKIGKERLTKEWFRRRYFWQGATNFFVRKYVLDYINERATDDRDYRQIRKQVDWFSVPVPSAASDWAEMFDDSDDRAFEKHLATVEGLGYLFASQALIVGR